MLGFFKWLFGAKIASPDNAHPLDDAALYEHEKAVLERGTLKNAGKAERLKIARNTNTHKEVLYYLAEKDSDPVIRRSVAENSAMPVQISPVLARDRDADVRLALAARLVALLPDLSEDKHSKLYAFAVQALGTLALDEVLKIRIALSSALKDHAHTPPKIAGQLARDVEREVSEPILKFCAALSDDDLLDILKGHPDSWAVEAIASRESVSEPVSEAVIDTGDRPGGRALLANDGASIAESLLQTIVAMSREYSEWQEPMATRKSLPPSIARDLAEFVDASVRDLLMSRADFDEETTEEIAAVFRRRMDFAAEEEAAGEEATGEHKAPGHLETLIKEGKLSEELLLDAVGMRDTGFVFGAIAHMAKTDVQVVESIFDMQAPKSLVALCWRAGLSMRTALTLQRDVARIKPKDLIYPRAGTDYPFTKEELIWQLEFLGLKKPS